MALPLARRSVAPIPRAGGAAVPTAMAPRASDAELVERARSGDRWATEALYRRYAPRLMSAVSRVVGRTTDADDVIQDAFVRALERLDELRRADAFGSWMASIALNGARRALRRRRLVTMLPFFADEGDDVTLELTATSASPETLAELRAIDRLLARQPDEYRIAWLLHRIEGWTIEETAHALDRSTATVKRHVAAVDVAAEAMVRRAAQEGAR